MHIDRIETLNSNLTKVDNINEGIISFSQDRIIFLNKLSTRLKGLTHNNVARGLALYIKRILKIDYKQKHPQPSYGVGIVVHYGPGNLPINSIYSWISGFLSGNINIVRTSKNAIKEQYEVISTIRKLCLENNYNDIFCTEIDSIQFATITSKYSDARVIWGSNNITQKIKMIKTKSNCRDIIFGNRNAAAIYNLKNISNYTKIKLNHFISALGNDLLFANGQPCTSPSTLFLIYENSEYENNFEKIVKDSFLNLIYAAESLVEKKDVWDLNAFSKQIENLQENALSDKYILFDTYPNTSFRLAFTDKPSLKKRSYRTFEVIILNKFIEIKKELLSKFNSFTYEGLTNEQITYLGSLHNCHRVIPAGQAHQFELIWDGIDTIRSLMKIPIIK